MNSNKTLFGIVPVLVFILLCFMNEISIAQSGSETYRHITIRDGLSHSFIWHMHQDRYGFIWIATNSGLDKYDGYSVTSYTHDPLDERSISRGQVFNILETRAGHMWIATASGLNLFYPGNGIFKTVRVPDTLQTLRSGRAIMKDSNGDLWHGSIDGLYHFPDQDYQADTLSASFYNIANEDTNDVVEIWSIAEGENNILWLGTSRGIYHFDIVTREFSKPGPFGGRIDEVLSNQIWAVMADRNKNIWISSQSGFIVWYNGEPEPELVTTLGDLDLRDEYMQSIYEDDLGNLWVGSSNVGAFRYHPGTGEVKVFRHEEGNPNSIAENDVHYIFPDNEGNVWFGYHNYGISMMYMQPWNYVFRRSMEDYEASHAVNNVRTISEDASGNLWIATLYGLVFHPVDGSAAKHFLPYPQDVSPQAGRNALSDLVIYDDQIITVSNGGDIYVFDIINETFQNLDLPARTTNLYSIVEHENHFLVSSLEAGLYTIEKGSFKVTYYINPYNDPENTEKFPMWPAIDVAGNVWVNAYKFSDVYPNWTSHAFDPHTGIFTETGISSPDNLTSLGPPGISSTQPGVIWGIHDNGILRQDLVNLDNRFYFQSDAGVFTNLESGILEDRDGYLWVGGTTGIMKLDPVTETITYYEADANRKPALFFLPQQMENGDILFGGPGGYTRFNPQELGEQQYIKTVLITELRVGGEVYNILYTDHGYYEIDHSNNSISLSYIGLNYKAPNLTRYRYRMVGYENNWIDVGPQQRVFLANLPPGRYTFEVQAFHRVGGTAVTTAGLDLVVLPPWWRTVPAYIGFFFLFAGLLVMIDRYQRRRLVNREKERNREKELAHAQEIKKAYEDLKAAQRQLVQQEKLASLGQLTAGIAHEIKNPLNFVNNFSSISMELLDEVMEDIQKAKSGLQNGEITDVLHDIKANLAKINEHGTRADNIVKSMLLHSRGKSGEKIPTDLNNILDEYVKLAYHGMRAVDKSFNIDIQTDYDQELPKLDIVPQDVSRAFLNIVNNGMYAASEYARSHSDRKPVIYIQTRKVNNSAEIRIKDNGGGIPDEIRDRIFEPFFTTKPTGAGTGLGLSMTYDIIKLHDGKLKVDSKVGEFTEFIIELPITNNEGN